MCPAQRCAAQQRWLVKLSSVLHFLLDHLADVCSTTLHFFCSAILQTFARPSTFFWLLLGQSYISLLDHLTNVCSAVLHFSFCPTTSHLFLLVHLAFICSSILHFFCSAISQMFARPPCKRLLGRLTAFARPPCIYLLVIDCASLYRLVWMSLFIFMLFFIICELAAISSFAKRATPLLAKALLASP
jgi:hypothetical protein